MERNVNCTVGTESSESEVGETTNSPNFTALLNKARENICGAKNLHNIVDSVANDIKTNYRKSIVKRAVHPVLVCSTPFSTQKTKNENSFSNFSTLSGLSDQPKNEELPNNKEKENDDCGQMGEDINIEIEKPDISIKNQETKSEIVDPDEFIEISDQEQTLTENNVEEELKKSCSDKIESATSNVDISSNKEVKKKNKKDDSKIIIVKEKSIDRTSRKKTRSPSEVKKSCIEYDNVTEDSEEESETVLERRKRRQKFSAAFSNHKNRMVKVPKGRSLSRKSKKYVIITESSEDDRKQRRKHSVKNREGRVIRVPLSESDVEVKRIRKHRGISRSSRYKYHVVDTDTSISSEHSESDSSSYYESKKQYLKHKSEKKAKIRDKSRLHRTQFSQNVRGEYSRGRRETKFLEVDDNHYRDKSKRLSRKDTFNLQSKTNRKKEKFRDIAHDISSSTIESTKTTKVVDLLSEIRNLLTVQKKEDSKGKNIVPEITNVANHDTIDNLNRKEMDFPVEAKKADMSTNQNLKKTKNDDADVINKIDINTNENAKKTKTDNANIVNMTHFKTNENLNKIKGNDTDVISRTHITTNKNVEKTKKGNVDIINKTHINTNENLKKIKRDNVDLITKRLVKTGENLNKIKEDDAGVINETHVNDEPNQNEIEPPLTPLLLKLNKVIKDEDLQFYRVRMDLLREHNNKTKRKLLRKIARQPNSFEYNKKAKISLFRNNKRCKKKKYVCRKKLDDVLASLSKNSAKKNRRTNTIGVQTSLIKTLEDSQANVRVTRSKDSPKSAKPNTVEHKKNSPLAKSPSEKNYLEKLRAEYISDSFEVSVVSTGAQSCEQNVIILQNLTVQKKRTEDDVVSSEDGDKVTKNKPRIPIHWAPLPCNVDDSSSENFNEDLELTQSVTSTESTYTPAIIMGKDAMKVAKVDRAEDAIEFSKGRSPQDKLGNKGKGGKENQKPPSKKDVINSPSSQNSPIDRKKVAKTTRKISPASESDDAVRIQQETTDKNGFLAKMDLSPHSEKPREVPNKSKKELRCKLNFEDTYTEPLDTDSGIKSDDLPSPRKTAIEKRKQEIARGRGVGTDKKVVPPHFVKPSKVPVRNKKKLPCTKLELQDSDTELLHTDAGIKNDSMEGMKHTSPRRKPAETRASVSPDDSRETKSFGSKHKRDIAEENVQEMNMDSGISNGSSVPPSNKKYHNLPEIYVQTSEIHETEASSRKTPQESNISSSEISADVSEEYFAKPVGVPKKSKKKTKSPVSKKDAAVEKQEKKKATKKQPNARTKKNKEAPEKNDSEVVVRRSNREKKAVDLDLFARIIQYSEKEVRKNAESAATSLVSEQSKNTSKSRSNKKTTSAAAKNVEKKETASRKTRASRQAENAPIKSKTDKSKGTTEEIPDEVEAQGSSENIEIHVAPSSSENMSTDGISAVESDTGTSNRSDTESMEKKKSPPKKRRTSHSKPPTKKTKKKTAPTRVSTRKKPTKNGIERRIESSDHETIENDENTTLVEIDSQGESSGKTSDSTEKPSNVSGTATEATSTVGEATAEIPDVSVEEDGSEKTAVKRKKADAESKTNKRRRKHGTMEMPSDELPADASSTIEIDIEAHREVWQTMAADVDRIGKGVSGTYKLTSACGFLALAPKNTQSFVNSENEQIYFRLEGTYNLILGNALVKNPPIFIIPKGVPAELRNTGKKRVLFMYAMR